MSLFNLQDVILHSGKKSSWIIDCESLTDDDLRALAVLGRQLVGPFNSVTGVPRGGLRFAEALREHLESDALETLVVDDVWTTGGSWREEAARHRHGVGVKGLVIFARGPMDRGNCKALFTLAPGLRRL